MVQKGYYAIIPANVRYDKRLTANAKLLYGEITALTNEKGYCWAKNKYFSDLYGVSKNSISRWIKDLKECGYINVEMIYKEGSKEIVDRYIRICGEGINNFGYTPIIKNGEDNNTDINNTINNTIEYIIDHLNNVTGSKFKSTTRKTQTLIKALLKEKYTIEDFKMVIEYKTFEWKNTEYAKYLSPTTLFNATKFEKYLNQADLQVRKEEEKPKYQSFDDIFGEV